MKQVGDRIGALQKADTKTVWLFGFGVYHGQEIPPADVIGPFATRIGLYGVANPKLVMDDGTVVWGCESWWASEKEVQGMIAGKEVIVVKPDRSPATAEEITEAAEMVAAATAALKEAKQ